MIVPTGGAKVEHENMKSNSPYTSLELSLVFSSWLILIREHSNNLFLNSDGTRIIRIIRLKWLHDEYLMS